jgi:opacity protein-like surface antigen
MSHVKTHLPWLGLIILPLAAAHAEDSTDRGFYAVARAGGTVASQAKFDASALSSEINVDDKVKYKRAPFGEVGAGYRFGTFRVEETLGYSSSNAKSDSLPGKARVFSLTVSGFADIPVSDIVVPYVGGGLGAVRVDSTGGTFESKGWGPTWHFDAGVGFRVAPQFTVEVGGRYERTFNMRKIGSGGDGVAPVSRYNATIATLGVRYAF